jgi:hypothetical protein
MSIIYLSLFSFFWVLIGSLVFFFSLNEFLKFNNKITMKTRLKILIFSIICGPLSFTFMLFSNILDFIFSLETFFEKIKKSVIKWISE